MNWAFKVTVGLLHDVFWTYHFSLLEVTWRSSVEFLDRCQKYDLWLTQCSHFFTFCSATGNTHINAFGEFFSLKGKSPIGFLSWETVQCYLVVCPPILAAALFSALVLDHLHWILNSQVITNSSYLGKQQLYWQWGWRSLPGTLETQIKSQLNLHYHLFKLLISNALNPEIQTTFKGKKA